MTHKLHTRIVGPARGISSARGLVLVPVDTVWRCKHCEHDEYNHFVGKAGERYCMGNDAACTCAGLIIGEEIT